jgi:AcrR family transcriptional regulator
VVGAGAEAGWTPAPWALRRLRLRIIHQGVDEVPKVPGRPNRRIDGSRGHGTRNSEQTRARILAAARKEFARKGFDGARVDAIAQRAQTSKRMLYYYFGTKAGLFRSVLENHVISRKPTFTDAPEDLTEGQLVRGFVSGS